MLYTKKYGIVDSLLDFNGFSIIYRVREEDLFYILYFSFNLNESSVD